MKTEITIKKVKINEDGVEMEYTEHIFTKDEQVINVSHKVKSEITPHEDFYSVYKGFKTHLINICELSLFRNKVDEKTMDNHTVTAINIFKDDENERIMISGNRFIRSGKSFSITTPLIDLNEEDYENLEDLSKLVKKLEKESKQFLHGKNGNKQLSFQFTAKAS